MNLSGGLNLSGRSNMLGSTKNCIQFFNLNFWREMKAGFLGDLNRGLNSLNSDTEPPYIFLLIFLKSKVDTQSFTQNSLKRNLK